MSSKVCPTDPFQDEIQALRVYMALTSRAEAMQAKLVSLTKDAQAEARNKELCEAYQS